MKKTITEELLIDSHKLFYHPERVAQWLSAKTMDEKMRVFPLYVEVSPVGHCNHRCLHCAVDYIGYKPRSIDLKVYESCAFSMAQNGVKSVMFAGEGEPMLHKQIREMTALTKAYGIDVAYTTNGTLMNDTFIEESLQDCTWIKVSLNAGDPDTYAAVHQTKREDYYKVFKHIQKAVAWKEANGLKTTLGIQSVVLPENIESMEQLVMDAGMIGVDYLVLKPYSQHHSSINKYDIAYKKWDDYLSELVKKYSTENFQVIYRRESALKTEAGYEKCYSTPNFWCYVMATGDVYSCSAYLLDERFNLGNINKQSFEAIWLGDKRRANLEYVENHLDISECRLNCRLDKGNQYLWQLKNPKGHDAFI